MSDNLFTPDQGDVTPAPAEPPIVNPTPAVPPELADLVGEGKKYKTVELALSSIPHAQSHIAKLEAELAAVKEEIAKRRTTQELLDELKSGIPQGTTTPKEIDQDVIERVVQKALTQAEIAKVHKNNGAFVASAFREVYGDKAEEAYNKVATEAGLPIQSLNELARVSPQAVIKLAGLKSQTPQAPGKIKTDVPGDKLPSFATPGELNARVKNLANSKEVVDAWKRAGEMVRKSLG